MTASNGVEVGIRGGGATPKIVAIFASDEKTAPFKAAKAEVEKALKDPKWRAQLLDRTRNPTQYLGNGSTVERAGSGGTRALEVTQKGCVRDMARAVSMVEFVQSGAFGPLTIGSTEKLARALLGEPDDIGRGLGGAVILRYGQGRLEISLIDRRVVLIALYLERGLAVTQVREDLPIEARSSAHGLRRWLEQHGLSSDLSAEDDEIQAVRIHGGATATFVDSRLDSLQAAEPAARRRFPATKRAGSMTAKRPSGQRPERNTK